MLYIVYSKAKSEVYFSFPSIAQFYPAWLQLWYKLSINTHVLHQACIQVLLKIRKYVHFSYWYLYFLKYSPYDKMVRYG